MHEVRTTGRIPVKSWATTIEDSTWDQATNLSNLPFALKHIALMPDAHPGYGMPIGGVLFADKAVVPYAVGVDIGCGVRLLRVKKLYGDIKPHELPQLLDRIRQLVPVGNGPQAQHVVQPVPWEPSEAVSSVAEAAINAAQVQLGSLGGGNHFLELQRDAEGNLYFMLHSGSRSVGKKICDYWHSVALKENRRWHSELPDKELAYLPMGTDEAHGYLNDMSAAMKWAEENRQRMANEVSRAIFEAFGVETRPVADIHHNYAVWENHFGHNGLVHRKGAVKAGLGDVVLIPGSMGTSSWLAEGLGNPESFETSPHGAGRARSRGATRKLTNLDEMEAQMTSAGVILSTPDRNSVVDESSLAYKDIDEVMLASADLVRPVTQLFPVGVVKG